MFPSHYLLKLHSYSLQSLLNMLMMLIIVIMYMEFYVAAENTTVKNINNETLLIKQLFAGYDPKARPLLDTSKVVDVNMAFQITTLKEVDTKSQKITVNGWLILMWTDERLTWNSSEYNRTSMVLPASMVWLPPVVVYNSAGDSLYNTHWMSYEVDIYASGSVWWVPGGKFQANCDISVTYFPFDEQICAYNFGLWMHGPEDVRLFIIEEYRDSARTFEYYHVNEEWELVNHSVKESTFFDIMSKVDFKLHIKRRHLFYTANVILVTVFLAVLVLMVFKLPVESGEKISMGVTLLLAFSVFILMVNEYIPQSSLSVPIIIIYLLSFMALTTLSICESVFVIYCYHHEGNSPPPKWLDVIRIMSESCKKRGEKRVEPVPNEKEVTDKNIPVIMKNKEKWQNIGLLTDRICFWLYVVMFTILIFLTLVILPKLGRLQLE